jgi:putative DNA primase/helicase
MTEFPGAFDEVTDHPPMWQEPGCGAQQPPIVLDPNDPMDTARKFVAAEYTINGVRTLHRYRSAFWVYRGSHFKLADEEYIQAQLRIFLDKAKRLGDGGEPEPFKPKRSHVAELVGALEAVTALDGTIETPVWLGDSQGRPAADEIFAVANGLLHLPTGILHPSTPQFFGLCASDVSFDREAREPRLWIEFLANIFGDDVEAIELLKEWFGYTLSPDTCQQKILLMVGPPRSGKGTIGRTHIALIGRETAVAPTLASLDTPFGLEPLIGKQFAMVSDARLSSRSDTAAIAERLLSISGEDNQTVHRKFRGAWTGPLRVRFSILTNELPRIADSSGALASRFLIIKLRQSFYGREDPGLSNRLLGDLPGILNWARAGYERLHMRGYFQQPTSGEEAVQELQALSSPATAFVRDACLVSPGQSESVDDVYMAWKIWCEANGVREGTKAAFSRDLHSAYPGIETKQLRETGGGRHRRFMGLALQPSRGVTRDSPF